MSWVMMVVVVVVTPRTIRVGGGTERGVVSAPVRLAAHDPVGEGVAVTCELHTRGWAVGHLVAFVTRVTHARVLGRVGVDAQGAVAAVG